ncbi:hypothetical protein [Vibrio owensii]|uniref:hypothetical protein n=1 Tax=Vibrio owensii TaxID=696485 RepID=UPI00406822CE
MTNPSSNSNIELRRRSLERYIECKSETMHLFLKERGGTFFAAIQRVAMMYQYTDDNEEHRAAVDANFKPLFEQMVEGVDEFRLEARAIKRRIKKKSIELQTVTPDFYKHQVPLTHWIFDDVIQKLQIIDRHLASLEALWILREIDDSQYRNIRLRSIRPFGTLNNEIYRITNQMRKVTTRGKARTQINRQIDESFLKEVEMDDGSNIADAVAHEASQSLADFDMELMKNDFSASGEGDAIKADDNASDSTVDESAA